MEWSWLAHMNDLIPGRPSIFLGGSGRRRGGGQIAAGIDDRFGGQFGLHPHGLQQRDRVRGSTTVWLRCVIGGLITSRPF